MRRTLGCVVVCSFALVVIGCGGGAQQPSEPAVPTGAVPAGLSTSSPPPRAAETAPLENVLDVSFQGINDKGLPVLKITNLTGEDIDDIRGGFRMTDSEGNLLFSTGLTEAIPGAVFLARGETKETVPYGLDRKPELMEILGSNPGSVSFSFEAKSVTFMTPDTGSPD